jgi:3-deoxy-D-manno-octulosonic-acid transferase
MFFLYNILLTIGFVLLLPRFLFDAVFSGKYADGFTQRLGFVPKYNAHGKPVVWVHCVSVGETNAARPLIERIKKDHPGFSLVVSTTTATGQNLARSLFTDIADLVFYFPFDWRSTVRRTLRRIDPAIILLVETELWFNFLRETDKYSAQLAVVNGRLSQKSFNRFRYVSNFMHRVLSFVDLALMQENADAKRLIDLGLSENKVKVTGNIKIDNQLTSIENTLTDSFRKRFDIRPESPLIIAASTHSPEEEWLLSAYKQIRRTSLSAQPRLLIAPRHPERFSAVADLIRRSGFTWTRRSDEATSNEKFAEVILLDSIGELRSAYPLAEIVFMGGSLIPHGGQSIFEPATAGRAIVTGPFTANFEDAVAKFLSHEALIQLPIKSPERVIPELASLLGSLLADDEKRTRLGASALGVMESNRGSVSRTLEYLQPLFQKYKDR